MRTHVKINKTEFFKWFDSLHLRVCEFEEKCCCANIVGNIRNRGYISQKTYKLLCLTFTLPDGAFVETENEIENNVAKSAAEEHNEQEIIALFKHIAETLDSINSKL